jgi:hypothetical protein
MATQEYKVDLSSVDITVSTASQQTAKPKKTPVVYLSAHLFAHLNWMYCELTGQDSAPSLTPSLRVCRLDSMFTNFFRHVDSAYFEAASIYRCTASLLERIFVVKLKYTGIETEMKKIGFRFMYFKLKDAHRLITQEYTKCDCYQRSKKIKEVVSMSTGSTSSTNENPNKEKTN